MSDESDLLAALMGKRDGSIVDQVDAALVSAWALSKGMDLTLPATGGAPGPYRPGGSAWDLAYDQACARWGAAPKARKLSEKVALLEALVTGIDGKRGGAGAGGEAAPVPSPSSLPWKPLPAVTAKLSEGDTSSYQHTAPRWTSTGMRIVMPARGDDGTQANPDKGADYQRCEVTVAGQGGMTGGRRFFRFVLELGAGFPVDARDWQVCAQWKADGTGSPPLSLDIRDGSLVLTWHQLPTTPVGKPVVIGPAKAGAVHDIVIDATFATSVASSPVSAWLNGVQTVNQARVGATLYAGKASRLKTGLYRSASIGRAADLTLRGFAAGATVASVTV